MWIALIITSLGAALGSLWLLRNHLVALRLGLPWPTHRVQVRRNVVIPMRDGIKLVADIYRPRRSGKYPGIVVRTPYEKTEEKHAYPLLGNFFASQGYVTIMQDTRGKHHSEGEFYPFALEESDGVDTVDWCVEQEWSDGNVGMFGSSYMGLTQWLSAPQQSDSLKAMVPAFIGTRAYDIVRGNHGVLYLMDVIIWQWRNQFREKRVKDPDSWDPAIHKLPVIQAEEALGPAIPCYKDWVTHPHRDGYWSQWKVDTKAHLIKAPALVIGGWYDRFIEGSIESYQMLRDSGGSENARLSQIIIGPWVHEPSNVFETMNFGLEASPWLQLASILNWYDRWLKGKNNGVDERPPVRIFVMGLNKWRDELEWPLARTEYQRLYLRADGKLSFDTPESEQPDTYRYDPMDPCPSIGNSTIYDEETAGPQVQTEVEKRDDVLVYSTDPLKEAVEVTGPIILTLHAATSTPDTDFTAKLCDVYPDGRSVYIKAGIVRARYRESLREPTCVTPGEVIEYTVEIGPTSNLFKKGHQIRLQISSSHFPEYSRNLNVEEDSNHTTKWQVADQSIHHSEKYPSHLVLPIIR